MPDQSVINELYRRKDSLAPDQRAIVEELAKRSGLSKPVSAGASDSWGTPGYTPGSSLHNIGQSVKDSVPSAHQFLNPDESVWDRLKNIGGAAWDAVSPSNLLHFGPGQGSLTNTVDTRLPIPQTLDQAVGSALPFGIARGTQYGINKLDLPIERVRGAVKAAGKAAAEKLPIVKAVSPAYKAFQSAMHPDPTGAGWSQTNGTIQDPNFIPPVSAPPTVSAPRTPMWNGVPQASGKIPGFNPIEPAGGFPSGRSVPSATPASPQAQPPLRQPLWKTVSATPNVEQPPQEFTPIQPSTFPTRKVAPSTPTIPPVAQVPTSPVAAPSQPIQPVGTTPEGLPIQSISQQKFHDLSGGDIGAKNRAVADQAFASLKPDQLKALLNRTMSKADLDSLLQKTANPKTGSMYTPSSEAPRGYGRNFITIREQVAQELQKIMDQAGGK